MKRALNDERKNKLLTFKKEINYDLNESSDNVFVTASIDNVK